MGPIDELTQQVAELRVRVEAAEAVQAIQNLKARYAQLVDERYVRGKVAPEDEVAAAAEKIAALFTEDGVWDGGPALGVSTGRAERSEEHTSELQLQSNLVCRLLLEKKKEP